MLVSCVCELSNVPIVVSLTFYNINAPVMYFLTIVCVLYYAVKEIFLITIQCKIIYLQRVKTRK